MIRREMRYLFFTNTPAHVHLYRNAVEELRAQGHEVLVLARDYGCTVDLLEYFDMPYDVYGACDTTKGSLFRELPSHYLSIFRKAIRYQPSLIFGIGGYAAHAGFVTRSPVILIHDSEPTTLDHKVSKPFADLILTPQAFQKDLGRNHRRFNGFKETAYLHPDVYSPEDDVRPLLGVDSDEQFAIIRFNAFGSHHDVGHAGFTPTERRQLIEKLSEDVTVFVSDEGGAVNLDDLDARPFDLHPALLHDALREARLVVSDSQTIATEAALLGTPIIRSNSFVGDDDMGNFVELAEHDLVQNVGEFDEVLDLSMTYARDPEIKAEWERRRQEYMSDLVNLTDLITSLAFKPESLRRTDTVSLARLTQEEPL